MDQLIRLKRITSPVLITLLLLCFGPLPKMQAVSPPPDGGYPGFNTAEGTDALKNLTTGVGDTAVGWFSLFSNTDGSFNTGVGAGTLLFNVGDQSTGEGVENTAVGAAALLFNTTGSDNTAVGAAALLNNTEGINNTATGFQALFSNTTGGNNTANGLFALFSNKEGSANTANGLSALALNTTGAGNTANGFQALNNNTSGDFNIALGLGAGSSLNTGDRNIDIGNTGVAGESSTIRIGSEFQTRTFIAAIRGVTTGVADAVNVVIDSNGQLGTVSSSRRYKKEIKAMEQASEVILALKPVTFHYKSDTKDTPQFGLIAEEVAEVNPDLVVRDENGEIYTVRYDAVNAMLLNEFLKEHKAFLEEHRKVEKLEATVSRQQKQIEAVATELQKVSDQVELRKAGQRTVVNNQ
jgi:Chaperone of endosialidase